MEEVMISKSELESLAKKLMFEMNRNFLSRIETGKSDPNAGILKSIAQIFNVDLNSLLDINNSEEQGIDKIKYITENCKYLQDKDLEFIVRIMSVMREEYVKINTDVD